MFFGNPNRASQSCVFRLRSGSQKMLQTRHTRNRHNHPSVNLSKMVLAQTPEKILIPRSETMLSPPPLKRKREHEQADLAETSFKRTMLPASLFLPSDLDSISDHENVPRFSLKPRPATPPQTLSINASTVPPLLPDMFTLVGAPELSQHRRMKRRRSSMSSCGADTLERLGIGMMMPIA